MTDSEDNIYKILIIGEGGVGKTSLTKQFVYQRFDDKYIKTLGTNISKKDVVLESKENRPQVHLQMWDVLGQKDFQAIIKSAFRGARGVMFVCDITDRESFEKLDTWVDFAYEYGPPSSFVFLANKSDRSDHQFELDEFVDYAKKFKTNAYITSAKTGDYVEEAFSGLAQAIYDEKYAPPRSEVDIGAVELLSPVNKITAEDRIIAAFCQEAGGTQVSMPIVRQHFQKHGIDFEDPSKDDLKKIIISLATYLKFIKGESLAKEYARNMKKVLKDMDMS